MSKAKVLGAAIAGLVLLIVICKWPSPKIEAPLPPQEEASSETVQEELPFSEEEEGREEVVVESPERLRPFSEETSLPPEVDRMTQLFSVSSPLLPLVETVSYSARVPWISGRSAYLGDYAAHYHTSKHFISRSLHGMGHYLSEVVSKGDYFNVLRMDKAIEFHLVLDLSRLKMWVYARDKDEDKYLLLKSYAVGAGRYDPQALSGSLTPLGSFALGERIAVYKPHAMGIFKNETREMISIFGTRWIPFDHEVASTTASCKGLGIHGVPWKRKGEELVEHTNSIGHYESNGCIHLRTTDMEELFAVIVSRPSYIHIVRDFVEAKLPSG